jgi:hypothetical protein
MAGGRRQARNIDGFDEAIDDDHPGRAPIDQPLGRHHDPRKCVTRRHISAFEAARGIQKQRQGHRPVDHLCDKGGTGRGHVRKGPVELHDPDAQDVIKAGRRLGWPGRVRQGLVGLGPWRIRCWRQ